MKKYEYASILSGDALEGLADDPESLEFLRLRIQLVFQATERQPPVMYQPPKPAMKTAAEVSHEYMSDQEVIATDTARRVALQKLFLRGEFKSLQDCVIVLDRERLYAIRYQNSATGEKTVLLAMAKAISGPHVAVLPSHGFWTSDLHSWTKTSTDNFPPKSDILHVMAFPGDGTAFYDSLSRRNF